MWRPSAGPRKKSAVVVTLATRRDEAGGGGGGRGVGWGVKGVCVCVCVEGGERGGGLGEDPESLFRGGLSTRT